MDKAEQISTFEGQLKESLDYQVEQLNKLDEKQAKVLSYLQQKILAEIRLDRPDDPSTDEKEGRYSEDLKLTEDELKNIFETIKSSNVELCIENAITDFNSFMSFIGFQGDFEVQSTNSLDATTLFGQPVNIIFPLGVSERILANYRLILEQIEERADLKPYINNGMRLTPLGGVRLEFTIQKDGRTLHYTANSSGVFRIDKQPSIEKRKEWLTTTLKIKTLERQYRMELKSDTSLSDEQRMSFEQMIHGDNDKSTRMHMIMRGESDIDLALPQKYQALLDRLQPLHKQEEDLIEACSYRELFDEKNGVQVREESDSQYTPNFNLEYLTTEGTKTRKISYQYNAKTAETEYYPGTQQPQKETYFHSDGKIRMVSSYNQEDVLLHQEQYRENGKLYSIQDGKVENVYDDNGEQVQYQRIWPEASGQVRNVMLTESGETFATLDYMKEISPEITDEKYLDYLAVHLNTPEKLHLFFELMMQYVHDDAELENADYKTLNIGGASDYWQTPGQTINRVLQGRMLGDCDDYAFLARDILRRQNKSAYVMSVPGHALCIWFDQRSDGKWNAYSMGTFGLDTNGNRYGRDVDPEKEKGYPTLREALDSLMPKYGEKGLGLAEGMTYRVIGNEIEILEITDNGKGDFMTMPIEMLKYKDALAESQKIREYIIRDGESDRAIKACESALAQWPSLESFWHEQITEAIIMPFEDTEEKIRKYLAFSEKYPERPEYHEAAGRMMYGRRNATDETKNALYQIQAEQYFRIAISRGTTQSTTYTILASICIRTDRHQEAVTVLEQALEKCPDFKGLHYESLVDEYLVTGGREKAIALLQDVIATYPHISKAQERLDMLIK